MPNPSTENKKLPILDTRAFFRPETVNEEKRTVELVFSTGAKVRRGFWDKYDEELSLDPAHVRMGRMNNGAPLLDSHSAWSLSSQLGVVERAWLEKGQMVGEVRFPKAEDDKEADQVFRKVKDGIFRNASIGYRVHKYEEVVDGTKTPGERSKEVPLFRAVDWEPYEISLCPIGADDGAGTRSERSENIREFECVLVRADQPNLAEVVPVNDGGTTDAKPASENATRGATMNEEEKKKLEAEAMAAAQAAAQTRSNEIMDSCRAAGMSLEFADTLLKSEKTVEQARAEIISEMAKRTAPAGGVNPTAPRIELGQDASDKFRTGAESWLVQRAGRDVQTAVEKVSGKVGDAGEFRGLSLVDLARMSLEHAGVKTRGMDKMKLVGEALTHRTGFNTTSDFPILLESVMNKTLLGAYAITPDTWSRFCKKGSVSDFRAHNRYRVGSFGALDQVNEHAEFKNKAIPDGEKASISAITKGNIIGLTRQAIINDDMDSFSDLGMRFGRAAKLSVEKDVYALIALNSGMGPTQSDGQAFFHANRKNVGTGSALSVTGLDADAVLMGSQMDVGSNEILDLKPSILLVPLGLRGAANVLNNSQYDPDANNKLQRPNIVNGMFSDIVATARLTGTRRYLFADPSIAPAFEVAFLDGNENPFLDLKDGWRIDGVEWKVRLDYGTAAIDARGAVTNAGA